VKSVQIPTEFIKEFIAGLEKMLADYPEGTEQEVRGGGTDGLGLLVRLAELTLSEAGISDREQQNLFSRIRALHAALASPDHGQYVDVTRVINKSWNSFKQTVRQAYMVIGLELQRAGWPSETERTAARKIADAFGVLDGDGAPDGDKVIGWRTTAKRNNPKYPLLHDQFFTGLRELENAFPGQPRQQYEAWREFVAAEWRAKI
jgi:hypothetical protein